MPGTGLASQFFDTEGSSHTGPCRALLVLQRLIPGPALGRDLFETHGVSMAHHLFVS